ncbi:MULTISPECIES: serine hydrolase domain-containing protein [unclassified Amycolatopsis]|uniref:serine hydrolase domain-containing protein n=1 Tax=unclassified Amycolatopsis TaxID=2618356 RepID=UPI0028744878|nr:MULTISPECIES: serine hydrolase domain-containing protein [unclassified Amycolatopsis]MDS0134467.1 beta-lactamase family protein [Amycolatopsis sp. 505]MDS0147815.1 beta-lactamase family protein [Amycolatopsis sp. CM201R]
MSKLPELSAWLQTRLPALLAEHHVPGAAVAVYAGGEIADHAAGVLNKATGVEADVDSLFQIGSITKVWTATLVMQLVDDGVLGLDRPVREYLPEFVLGDEEAAARITVRQLLCHTAGFEGDIFTDTGRGADCVEKYVATLGDVPQLFAPGEMFSYNNAGFCVLGRLVEVLRGKTYDACLQDHLFTPLGLTHAAQSPYEAIRFRAALGHLTPSPGAEPEPASTWALAPSNAPAGSMLAMRPRDLVTFAAMHLRDGEGADGTRVLGADSARAMRERLVELPDLGLFGDAWGLGWSLFDAPGGLVVGHDGGTIGQSAFLRVAPEHDVAVALLTNGGDPIAVYTEVVGHVLRELTGIALRVPPVPDPAAPRFDASRYVGEYSSSVADIVVSQDDDGRVWVERIPKGILAELAKPEKTELVALNGDTLILAEPMQGMYVPHAFVGDDGSGRALYLHTGRADRRVDA